MVDRWRFQKPKRRWPKVLGIGFLVLILIIGIWALIPEGTPAIGVEGSIASLETVELGGLEQAVLMRGHSEDAPVVLFLHGGPGSSQISLARRFMSDLEKDFVVVNWDQRGSGKSWSKDIDAEDMTVEHFVSDTIQLTNWLRERFNQEKIYLVGHSWGSYIGVLAAKQHPELFHAYIGVGQMTSFQRNEVLSYEHVLATAMAQGKDKAVQELEAIGAPPYSDVLEDTVVQRRWLDRFGGIQHNVNMNLELAKSLVWGREYTLMDFYRYLQGNMFSFESLFAQLQEVDLFEQAASLDLPIWLVAGRHDYNTVSALTQEYYETLEAPQKELVWFEASAHLPMFEEPEEFASLMVRIHNQK